jgi:hypothetical protein
MGSATKLKGWLKFYRNLSYPLFYLVLLDRERSYILAKDAQVPIRSSEKRDRTKV